ncbi:hypothetical protein JAAARDRAFT_689561 [Jaapia argillacea MUCL 33604]|uniref:Uncharacterized protein n=1 Tax=Jaapia argillacea MUCL 33604 TaxID=933084 RepID=A0A067PPF0_9AGAM|nr:hypothetical protein JAAARDRAFT_689561 [Jaapia argillacea MUCL 33604]
MKKYRTSSSTSLPSHYWLSPPLSFSPPFYRLLLSLVFPERRCFSQDEKLILIRSTALPVASLRSQGGIGFSQSPPHLCGFLFCCLGSVLYLFIVWNRTPYTRQVQVRWYSLVFVCRYSRCNPYHPSVRIVENCWLGNNYFC